MTNDEKKKLNTLINNAGLELLENKQGILIENIREVIIEFSELLSKKLNYHNTCHANFFAEAEATTIA